jgi:hypothetical protein
MKQPKLKAYYTALNAREYQEFERTRQLEISRSVSINPLTGAVTGRRYIHLAATAELADTEYRQRTGNQLSVWVLRVPADQVDRSQLAPTAAEQVWVSSHSLHLPHCGVMRFDLQDL